MCFITWGFHCEYAEIKIGYPCLKWSWLTDFVKHIVRLHRQFYACFQILLTLICFWVGAF